MRVFIVLSIVLCTLAGILFSSLLQPVKQREKINGVSLVSPHQPISAESFDPVKEIHANWVSIIPYGFSRSQEPEVHFDQPRQWWGERSEGICQLIEFARSRDLKIMLKPHVWVRGEGWTGEYELSLESDWLVWESAFRDYILANAKIADSMQVDLLCIGTEYRKVVQLRPAFWKSLIDTVRTVYHGPITYAANWDNYQNVNFWDDVDYIGIDAYFPLHDGENPSVEALRTNWELEYDNLRKLSKKYDKPILFTEYGYQSVKYTAGKHWEIDKEKISMESQSIAYQALFDVFWHESWFAGGFFWKWHFQEGVGGHEDPNFTPQGKPAIEVISKYYESPGNP